MHRRKLFTVAALATLVASFVLPAGSSFAQPIYPTIARAIQVSAAAATSGEPIASPIAFTMAGVSYQGQPIDLQIRTRTAEDEPWSEWLELDTDTAEGPDRPARTGSLSTSLAWTGSSHQLQIKAENRADPIPDLTVHVIDSTGEAANIAQKAVAWAKAGASTRLAHAGPAPPIVSRAEWGADESLRRCDTSVAHGLKGSFLHHTASSNDYSPSDSPAIVRSILHYHTQVRGWCDIGYNFLIDRYGTTFEGRSGGIDKPVIGAHAGGFNTSSVGIAVIGDLSGGPTTSPSADAIVRLIGWKFTIHRVLPKGQTTFVSGGAENSRYPEGTSVTLPTVAAHRDVSHTACPARLYELLPSIRNAVVVDFKHPDGSLIKGSGAGIFHVAAGKKQAVPSASVFLSRFGWNSVIGVSDHALSFYPDGPVLGFRDGTLIMTPDGTVSIISGGARRGFVNQDAFLGMGFSFSNVKRVSSGEAGIHPEGIPIASAAEPHPTGALLKGSDSLIYYIDSGKRRPVPSAGIFESHFRWAEVISVPQSRLSYFPEGEFLGYRDGSLLLTPDGTVWLISNGSRRGFTSGELFLAMGYSFSNILSVSFGEAFLSREGPTV